MEKTPGCSTCDEGKLETYLIDDSGCAMGDAPKLPGHAVGDYHWHCCHNTDPLKDCPLCGEPPKLCVCGCPDWSHQAKEGCGGFDDECPEECKEFEWDGNTPSWK